MSKPFDAVIHVSFDRVRSGNKCGQKTYSVKKAE